MKRRHLALFLLLVTCISCSFAIDPAARDAAARNSRVVGRLALGQTTDEVQAIFGHGPERREAKLADDGKALEVWYYITDYDRELMTRITFVDGKVTEIGQAPWRVE